MDIMELGAIGGEAVVALGRLMRKTVCAPRRRNLFGKWN